MAMLGRLRFAARRFCTDVAESEPKKKEKLYKKIGQYFLNIANDYKLVAEETLQDMKERPIKSGIYLSLLGSSAYLFKTNPSEQEYKAKLIEHSHELLVLGTPIRNPKADNHVQNMLKYYNSDQMRRFTIGICSVMWTDHYAKGVDVYEARAAPLKIGWLEWKDFVVDVGYNGRWHWLDKAMIDYDINPEAWPTEETKDK